MIESTKKYLALMSESYGLKSKLSVFMGLPKLLLKRLTKKHEIIFPFNVILKNRYGIFFCGKNSITVNTCSSFHEPTVKKYLSLNKGVFVDIGANVGKYSIYMGRKSGDKVKVISFEPEPYNFKLLLKNIRLNNLKNVFPQNVACFSNNASIKFFVEEKGGGMHSIYPGKKHNKMIKVNALKLDDSLGNLNVKKVDLIKIDAEGAEYEVLKGATKTLKNSHPKIIFESSNEDTLKKCESLLKKYNYLIEHLMGEKCYYIAK